MKKLTNQSIRKSVFAASAVALALSSGFAQAALVTEWGYSTNATLSAPTWKQGTNAAPYGDGTVIDTLTEFSWGVTGGNFQIPATNATNRSALTVGNFAKATETLTDGGPATSAQLGRSVALTTDAIISGNEIGRGTSFTHWNNPIWNTYDSLAGGKITDTITLFPDVNSTDGEYQPIPNISGPTLIFSFSFLETDNNPGSNVCADGSNQASVYPGGCPDLFGYQNTQVLNQSFVYDSTTYFLQFLLLNADGTIDSIGIPTLTTGECDALDLDPGCFGFRTLEGQKTTKRFGFAITSAPISVPEPGSLALLGLGLFGISRIMRRKTTA